MPVLHIEIDTGSAGMNAAQLASIESGFGRAASRDPQTVGLYLNQVVRSLKAGTFAGGATVTCVCDAGNGVAASGTITCDVGPASPGDTVTVAGEVFTCISNADVQANTNQFFEGTTSTETAANLAAAINASAIAGGLVVAVAVAAVITLTSRIQGLYGNGITMATSDGSAFTLSAATLASGTASTGNAAAVSTVFG